jgi:hypothetical protein
MNNEIGSMKEIAKLYLFIFAVSFLVFAAVILVGSFASFQRGSILKFLHNDYYSLLAEVIGLVSIVGYLLRFCRSRGIKFNERFCIRRRVTIISASNLTYALILLAICLVYDRVLSAFRTVSETSFTQSTPWYSEVFTTIYLIKGINTVLLGPIREELISRGFMFPIFRKRLGAGWGIIVTSLVFSLLHLPGFPRTGPNLTPILISYHFIAGILFNWILIRERNLLSSIVFHSFANLLILVFYI